MTDRIVIDDLPVACIVGILPEERTTPQPVLVRVELELDLTGAAVTGDLARSVDYAALAQAVEAKLKEEKYGLLETAALALCRLALASAKGASAASITLAKPKALGGRGIPGVTVRRSRGEISV